jgi:hypothetical protein
MRCISIRLSLWLVGLLATLSSQQAFAQVTAPSQGGGVNVVYSTATTLEINFGANGTGQGRVVAMAVTKFGMQAPLSIVDGQWYQGSTTYGKGSPSGKGYVVYNGKDHSAIITGLQPNTYYYIMNAEYNTDDTSISYNTRGTSVATATKAASPLPVELTSFTGTINSHNTATLRWVTASERNTAYFALERSADGTSFIEVGQVQAATNSTKSTVYQWIDPLQITSLGYYRLRQVDLDGETRYSSIVTLSPTLARVRILDVYPNPSAGQSMQLLLQGYTNEKLTLHLTDTMGRLMSVYTIMPTNGQYLSPLPLPQGTPLGTYIITLLCEGDHAIQKRITVSN